MSKNKTNSAEASKGKPFTVRLDPDIEAAIESILREEVRDDKSKAVRELIRDGLRFRNMPQPLITPRLQEQLILLLVRETGAMYIDQSGQVQFSENVISKLKRSVKGSAALYVFIPALIAATIASLLSLFAFYCVM